jgi:membrane protein DedA with SNARE-associated domain
MQGILDWLSSLPPAAMYLALALTAAAENVFPPLPADTVVAFGSFVAARGQGSALGAFLATWIGNISGAMLMYWVGARYGAERITKRFGGAGGEERLQRMYAKYGIWAIAISRFLPGVRAIVPPFAGALKVGAVRTGVAMAAASGLWYGGITYLAFNAGSNFESLTARIAQGQKWLGIGAAVVATIALVVWLVMRRRK